MPQKLHSSSGFGHVTSPVKQLLPVSTWIALWQIKHVQAAIHICVNYLQTCEFVAAANHIYDRNGIYSIMEASLVSRMWSVRIHGMDISMGN